MTAKVFTPNQWENHITLIDKARLDNGERQYLLVAGIQQLDALPAEPGEQNICMVGGVLYLWNGTEWQSLAKGANVPDPSDLAPLADGTASPGVSAQWARGDHVHPSDPSKASAYKFIQSASATTWDIVHNLGHQPTVQVYDSGGTAVIAQSIRQISDSEVSVTVIPAMAGFALLR